MLLVNVFSNLSFIFGNDSHNYMYRFIIISTLCGPCSIASIQFSYDLISNMNGLCLSYYEDVCHDILVVDFVHNNTSYITE